MTDQQRARVAIARTENKHRSQESIYPLVKDAVELVGGIASYVKPGQTVLIKPNQTVFYPAEDGVTTDPLLVGALIRLAREAGASQVTVADSSGDNFPTLRVMEITGMKAIAEKEGAKVVDFKQCEQRRVEIPNGITLSHAMLPDILLDVDVIINAPKAKTHEGEHLTCALKNWVGTQHQEERRKHHDGPRTAEAFMDIMSVTRPHLNVVDAIICGEGDGPIGNLPRWNGCVVASDDPIATDLTVARMMGIDWKQLKFARQASKHHLGVYDPGQIDIIGTPLEKVKFKAWTGHDSYDYYSFNFIVGEGVTMEGTIGHVKAILDAWIRQGVMQKVLWLRGTPTFLIGNAEDPQFEEHLKQGPYVVIDDAAPEKYKNDPRVKFVPGHPVCGKALPGVLESMDIKFPGKAMMTLQQLQYWGMNNVQYGTAAQKAKTIAIPVVAAAAAALLTYSGIKLIPGRHAH